ncbi:MAG: DUF433 domain-containing protein [Tepidiforma sp.]
MDLCELVVVRGFRQGTDRVARLSLDRLRKAHAFASVRLGIDHPFASERLYTDGAHILHQFDAELPGPVRLAVDREGQVLLPFEVAQLHERFEFDSLAHLALRWFPVGRAAAIVVDPARAGGMPTVEGRNLRVDYIVARFKRGDESIDFIARDLELERATVEAAIRLAA